ncbi:AmmeMemoRadiSam system protein A [Candidatus Sumerlaeota bacterium]|nr:AmmeMemoRadiSam system protein A [Candidatus Sumerlaeota bacterium]
MPRDSTFFLSPEEEANLLRISRYTMEKWVRETKYPSEKEIESFSITPGIQEKSGVFVSLHKLGELRGCIGYITGTIPLFQAVIENTVNAASKDSRFPPVQEDELDMIGIEISVMTPLQPVDDINMIEVGRDGLVIEKGFHQGLLLPQVATEWGWDRKEFLEQTCRKAGLPADAYLKKDVRIFRFQARVFGEKRR